MHFNRIVPVEASKALPETTEQRAPKCQRTKRGLKLKRPRKRKSWKRLTSPSLHPSYLQERSLPPGQMVCLFHFCNDTKKKKSNCGGQCAPIKQIKNNGKHGVIERVILSLNLTVNDFVLQNEHKIKSIGLKWCIFQ